MIFRLVIVFSSLLVAFTTKSQINCNGQAFISQRENNIDETELYYLDINGSNVNFDLETTFPFYVNGIGMSPVTQSIYGILIGTSQIYRMETDGDYESVYTEPSGTILKGSGACNYDNQYVIHNNHTYEIFIFDLDPFSFVKNIDLSWHPSTGLSGDADFALIDIAFSPDNPNVFYTLKRWTGGPVSTHGWLMSVNIDPASPDYGQFKKVMEVPESVSSGMGALFFGSDGYLYGYGLKSFGEPQKYLYEMDLENKEVRQIAEGPGARFVDGCSCVSNLIFKKSIENRTIDCGESAVFHLDLIWRGRELLTDLMVRDTVDFSSNISLLDQSPSLEPTLSSGPDGKQFLQWSADTIYPGDTLSISFEANEIGAGNYCNQAFATGTIPNGTIFQPSDDTTTNAWVDPTCFEINAPSFSIPDTSFCPHAEASISPASEEVSIVMWKSLQSGVWKNPPVYFSSFQTDDVGLYEALLMGEHCSLQDTFRLDLLDGPTAEYQDVYTGTIGESVHLEPINTSSDIIDWKWLPDQGLSCADCPDPIANDPGQSDYQVIFTNEDGCADTVTVRIEWEEDLGKWPCNGTAYITLNEQQPPTSFNEIIYEDNGYQFQSLFSIPLQLNGVGFSRSDGYMYAVGREDSDIYRIFADGTYEWVYHQDGIDKWYLGAGACSRHGKYLVQQQGDFDCYLYKVDPFELEEKFKLTWHPSSGQSGVVDVRFRDFAFDPNNPDIVYAHQRNEPEDDGPAATRGYMFKFNVDPDHPEFAQLKTLFEIPTDLAANFGAMFFGPDGALYGYGRPTGTQNQNSLYKIDLDEEECTLEDTGDGAHNADGCSCVSNLHLTKTVGEDTYQCGDTACFTLQLVNIGLDTIEDVRLRDTFDRMHYESIEVQNDNWTDWNLNQESTYDILSTSIDRILPGDTLKISVCLQGLLPGEYCNQAMAEGRTVSQVITQESDDPSQPGFLDPTCFEVLIPDPVLQDTAFCEGSSAPYTIDEPGVALLEWKSLSESNWREPPVYFSNFQTDDAGLYEALLDDGPCQWRDTFRLDLLDGPEAAYRDVYTGYVGTGIHINPISSSPDIVNWQWIPEAGLSCTDCPDPVVSDSSQTEYVVVVTNQTGCTDSIHILLEWEKRSNETDCNGQAYISQRNYGEDRTELYRIQPESSTVNFDLVSDYPVYFNGIGFDPLGRNIYAVGPGTNLIYRIHTDGTYEIAHVEPSVPSFQSVAGVCNNNGKYLLYDRGDHLVYVFNIDPFSLDHTIDLSWHPSTGNIGDADIGILDIAFKGEDPDKAYVHQRDVDGNGEPLGTKGWLLSFSIDPGDSDFGQLRKVMRVPTFQTVDIGALFFGSTGYLYGYGKVTIDDPHEHLYEFNLEKGTSKNIADGPSAGYVDGCSCVSSLVVTKNVRNTPVRCTDSVIFDLEVIWQGRDLLRNIIVRDTMPNTWHASIRSSSGAWENVSVTNGQTGTIVSWFADEIEPGDTLRTSFAVSGMSPGTYCNQAFAGGNTPSRTIFQPSDDTTTNAWNDPTCFEVLPAEDITDEISWKIEAACSGGSTGSITLYWDGFEEDSVYVIGDIDTLTAQEDSLQIPDLAAGEYVISQISPINSNCPLPVDLLLEVSQSDPSVGYPDSSFCVSAPVLMQPELGGVELLQWKPVGASDWRAPPVQFDAFAASDAGDYVAQLTDGPCEWMSTFTLDLADPPTAEYLDLYVGVAGNGAYLHPMDLSPEIVEWEWIPQAGLSCTDCPDPIALDTNYTEYRVIITNTAGCSDTIPVEIEWQNNTNQWPCNGGALISTNGPDVATSFNELAYRNDSYDFNERLNIPLRLNGLGFSRQDGYLYAADTETSAIYRILRDGTYKQIHDQAGVDAWNIDAGACSQNGTYLAQHGNTYECFLYHLNPFRLKNKFTLSWHPSSGLSGDVNIPFSDVVFDPRNPDIVYAHHINEVSEPGPAASRGYLLQFNVNPTHPDFGQVKKRFHIPASVAAEFGALFFGPDNKLYGYGRSADVDVHNTLYKIDLEQETVRPEDAGEAAERIDGCSCNSNLIVQLTVRDEPVRCTDTVVFDATLIWQGRESLENVYLSDTLSADWNAEILSSSTAWEETNMSVLQDELVLNLKGASMEPGDSLRASFAVSGMSPGDYCLQAIAGGKSPIRNVEQVSDNPVSRSWSDATCFEVLEGEDVSEEISWSAEATCPGDSSGRLLITWEEMNSQEEYLLEWSGGTDTLRVEEGHLALNGLAAGTYSLFGIEALSARCPHPADLEMEVPTWDRTALMTDTSFCAQAVSTVLPDFQEAEVDAWKPLKASDWRSPPIGFVPFVPDDTGDYEVRLDNGRCSWRDTFEIGMHASPWAEYKEVYAVRVEEDIRLDPVNYSPDIIRWQWLPQQGLSCTNCPDPIVTDTLQDHYRVIVTNDPGCTDTVRVRVEYPYDSDLYVPNVFSPNRDGINDYFEVYPSDWVIDIVEVEIFNRWGDRVYYHKGEPKWDGRFKGQRAQQGVYVVQLTYRTQSGEEKVYKGDVTLVR